MSLRANLIRFGLRTLLKRSARPGRSLAATRRQFAMMGRFVPRPPRGTATIALDAGGVPADSIATPASRADRHVLYLHGGAFYVGSPALYRDFTWRIADAARARVLCIDYRLAPEHPFPAAVDDAVTAYRWLLQGGATPAQVAFVGDSAGGGLTFAALMRLRDEGTPLPAAAVAISPWTDLALTGASLRANAAAEAMLAVEILPSAVAQYLAGADPRHPHASPIYGNASRLPPMLILTGSDDVLLDDAMRMADAMRKAGCDVEAEVWPRMFHAWPVLARILPEGRAAVARIGAFLDRRLQPAPEMPRPPALG